MSVKRYTYGFGLLVETEGHGTYVLNSDYAALEARHNALRHNTKVIINAYRENRKELDALREAVAWERECIRQLDYVGKFWDDDNVPGRELIMILDAARAEVDRLLEEK